MIRGFISAGAPVVASAGLYGIESTTLGMALLVIMALAVIVNQLWTLFEKVRGSIRNPEADMTGLASAAVCEQRHAEIERSLANLKSENDRQDRVNREQFEIVTDALSELKREMREDIKGLHKRSDDVLRAVSRLEGKVS